MLTNGRQDEYMTPSSPHIPDKMSRAELKTRTRRRRGQSLVEFSLIMPVLFLAMTGMLSFGMTMHDYLALTNGVNSGAQVLSMSRGQTTDPCATASAAVQSAAPSLTSANLSYTISVNGTSYTGTTCTTAATNMLQGTSAQVTVGYPCVLAVYGMNAPACGLKATTAELIQ
jgi:Flp pilus assembly protein TadG